MTGRVFLFGTLFGLLLLTGPLCFVVGRYGADIETARALVAAEECLRHERTHVAYLDKFLGIKRQPVAKPAVKKRPNTKQGVVKHGTQKPPRSIGGEG